MLEGWAGVSLREIGEFERSDPELWDTRWLLA